jgi:hypothetical protein
MKNNSKRVWVLVNVKTNKIKQTGSYRECALTWESLEDCENYTIKLLKQSNQSTLELVSYVA